VSRDIEDLHPRLRLLCRNFLTLTRNEDIGTFLTCTYRSVAEQDELFAQGHTAPGRIVTNAKGGQSAHNHTENGAPAALAFDIAIRNTSNSSLNWDTHHPHWKWVGEIGKSLGLTWGGDWRIRDYPHFELKLS
jgi:peptidoglycan L-alanyl-D-glutamate endopeptidase CwlK